MIGIVRSQDPSIPKKLHFYRHKLYSSSDIGLGLLLMGYRYALFQINATHCDACFGTVNLVVSVESVWSTITPALAIFFSLLVQFDELVLKLTSSADFISAQNSNEKMRQIFFSNEGSRSDLRSHF